MDIQAKLLETVDANDPQFKMLLINALQIEIATLEEELSVKRRLNERKRKELATVFERRQNLKKSIQEKSKLVDTMTRATYCLQDYSKHMLEKLEITKNMLDEDSLQKLSMIKETEKLRDKYEKKWGEYQAEFEKAPLAKERRATKEELQKVEIELEVAKMSIKVMEQNYRDYKKFQEIKLQKDIVALAELWINHRNNVENLKKLRQEDAELKSKITEQERQIKAFIKEKADKEKQKALARFQMPPPIMDKKLVETIFSQNQFSQSTPKTAEKRRCLQTSTAVYSGSLDDSDSVSISSSVFEEMCSITEKHNSAEIQGVQQVETEPNAIFLTSNQDLEFSGEVMSEKSSEVRPERSLEKSLDKSSDLSRIRQNEKPVLKNPETSKRPANSPQESSIRKKNKDNISTQNINPKGNISQEKSSTSLDTIKTIQENMRKHMESTATDNLSSLNIVTISPNHSYTRSINSISFNESNINQKGSEVEFNSDLSVQSNLVDQNNSINFSADEISDARSDINLNEGNAVNPDPPASGPTGMFASQNKRFLNFQGLFYK